MTAQTVYTPATPQAQQVLCPLARRWTPQFMAHVVIQSTNAHRELQRVSLLEAAHVLHSRRLIGNTVPSEVHLCDACNSLSYFSTLHIHIDLPSTILHSTRTHRLRALLIHHSKLQPHIFCNRSFVFELFTPKAIDRSHAPTRQGRDAHLATLQPLPIVHVRFDPLEEIRNRITTILPEAKRPFLQFF